MRHIPRSEWIHYIKWRIKKAIERIMQHRRYTNG